MDEPSASSPEHAQPPAGASVEPPAEPAAGFRARGRVRRRARFLRKARELAYRDLGGLVFNLHRFGQRNDALVLAKLAMLTQIDSELRSIEAALSSRQPVTVLREAGVTACPRCAAIHSGEDRFCPGCGLPLSRHVDLPISGAVNTPAPAAAGAAQAPPAPGVPAGPASAAPASAAPAAAWPGTAAPATPEPVAAPALSPEGMPVPAAPVAQPPASAPPYTAAPGRSPAPPSEPRPADPSSDGSDEQPTQAFPSRAPST